MKKNQRRILSFGILTSLLLLLVSCGNEKAPDGVAVGNARSEYPDASVIVLSNHNATLNGVKVETYDYTWHCDPTAVHTDVKNAPAEYYTGTKPETDAAVYIDSDLPYMPMLDTAGFRTVNYDGETEWAYYYADGENDDYIFVTLPHLGSSLPAAMMHTEAEAAENRVLHITKAGTYILEGTWHGQISIDLGEEAFTDENAKVALILNGIDVTCSVAPGLVFANVYECDNEWEDRETHSNQVNTEGAGAVVILADGSSNLVTGQNIYRMLKTKVKDAESTVGVPTQKKVRKLDAAFYSYMTMQIDGGSKDSGKLVITSGFEGLDSELHLAVDGGNVTVNSGDDGINVNEDNVSVFFMNGGTVTLNPAQGAEGDGVDSNGYIVINGGTLSINGVTAPDSALDSEDGITYNGGTVIIDGKTQFYTPGSTFRESGNGGFPGMGGRDDRGGFPGGPGGNGGRPPEPPDGQHFDESGQPPELPDGQHFDESGQPPEIPGGQMPGGNLPQPPQ